MLEAFSQMFWPLLACFVLVGIHAYLGIHVIARKVIFVDLALAQIAALGAVYGVLLGFSFETDTLLIKLISVCFTLLGAWLCTFTKKFDERVPHEALIGIIYASALSLTFLLTSHLPHGSEEVELMLTGNILWVRPKEVIFTALLYSLVGLVHVIFRKRFFASKPTALWDFLFYATFGVVVTSSVGMGGVLLVFGYLVIPSVLGVLLSSSTKNRLLIGWGAGVLMSALGIIISYHLDLPSGPTIVVLLAILLAVVLLIFMLVPPKRFLRVAGLVVVLGLLSGVFLLPFFYMRASHEHEEKDLRALLSSSKQEEVLKGLLLIKDEKRPIPKEALVLLKSPDDKVRARTIEVLKAGGETETAALRKAFAHEPDEFIKLEIADALLTLGDVSALMWLKDLAINAQVDFVREDALSSLKLWVKTDLDGPELIRFIQNNDGRFIWDEKLGKYFLK